MAKLSSNTGVAYVISAKDISKDAVNSAVAGTKKVRNSTERMAKQTERDMTAFAKSMKSAMATVATLVGAAGLTALVKQSMSTIDALAKTSDKLGVATEKLAGLRHASELAGIGSNTMEMALQRMTRRLAEAAQGTGEAQNAIKELNLNAEALAAMAPDQALAEIADAMQQVGSQSDKVRLAFKLFDSEGVAMVNMLKDGSAGLREAQQEAERLGLTISRMDAKKIEEANDALTKMKSAVVGLTNELTIRFAPAIERAATAMTNWLTGSEFTENINRLAEIRQQIKELEYQLNQFDGWSISSSRVKHYAELEQQLWSLRVEAKKLGAEVGSLGESWAQSARSLNAAEKALTSATTQTKLFTFETQNLGDTLPGVVMALQDYFAVMDASDKASILFGDIVNRDQAQSDMDWLQSFYNDANQTMIDLKGSSSNLFFDTEASQLMREQTAADVAFVQESYANMNEIVTEAQGAQSEQFLAWLSWFSESTLAQQKKTEQERKKLIKEAARAEIDIRQDLLNNIVILLTILGNENEAFTVAAIAISTTAEMVRAYQATMAAATLAFASQLIPGVPSSLAHAEAARQMTIAMGLANVAAIGAIGAVRIGQTLSGTGSEGVDYTYDYNSSSYSSDTTSSSSSSDEDEEESSRALVVQIHNYGYIGADADSLARTLVPAIRKAEADGV